MGMVLAAGLGMGAEVVEMEPYEVEAWHFDGLATAVPAGVKRLEAAEIGNSGAGTVPELLEKAAGVRFRSFTGNGLEGQPAMRGFGDNSGLRVLVLVDGQVYNNPDMGGLSWSGLDLGELESVEVLRGGQTVLYGNHAVSGVIKLETGQPGPELEGVIGAEWGSEGLQRWSFGAGQRIGWLGLRASGTWFESDGYRENSAAEGGSAHLGWRIGDNSANRWTGRIRYDDSKMEFPGPLTYQQMLENPRQSTHGGNQESANEEWQATVRGEGETAWGKWQLLGGVLQRERDWNLSGIVADNEQRRGTLSPRVRWGTGTDFLMLGADLGWDLLDYQDYLGGEERIIRAWAELERKTLGSYLFGSRELSGGWELSGGVRAERAMTDNLYVKYREEQLRPELQTNRGTVPNPAYKNPPDADPDLSFEGPTNKSGWAGEVSVLKALTDGLNVWAGWDRAYRYPALDETASYQGYPLSDPLNASLDPETGNNFEVGLKRFGTHWHFGWTAFLLRMDDEIAFDDAARLNRNIGDTERKGMELDAAYQMDRYGISANASFIRARFRNQYENNRLPLVPELETGLTVWMRPVDPVRLQVHYRYFSSQVQGNDYQNAFREIPGYGLIDVSVQWEPLPGLRVMVVVNNVFDQIHAVSAYNGGFYPGAGRQGQVRLKYSF
ncbi:MAG TPA: TonB-dependent receptor [Oceanipulchritudo sp.]|nr:TonB-dependent receptor [Oceanipulchritudo sp.]